MSLATRQGDLTEATARLDRLRREFSAEELPQRPRETSPGIAAQAASSERQLSADVRASGRKQPVSGSRGATGQTEALGTAPPTNPRCVKSYTMSKKQLQRPDPQEGGKESRGRQDGALGRAQGEGVPSRLCLQAPSFTLQVSGVVNAPPPILATHKRES